MFNDFIKAKHVERKKKKEKEKNVQGDADSMKRGKK
jgi:hypothetical protein